MQPVIAGSGTWYSDGRQLQAQAAPDYVPDELIVMFHEGVPASKINAINEFLNVQVISTLQPGRLYLIKVTENKSLEEVRRAYASFPEVKSVNINYLIKPE